MCRGTVRGFTALKMKLIMAELGEEVHSITVALLALLQALLYNLDPLETLIVLCILCPFYPVMALGYASFVTSRSCFTPNDNASTRLGSFIRQPPLN